MSLTAPPVAAPRAPAAAARPSRTLLACAAVACVLVLASGAVRSWQARRVADKLNLERESPFPLDKNLPMTLGDWVGEKTELDPQIVAGTGSNDLITRRYINRVTGVAVEVIVLHGPASDVFVHTPDYCYPRAGYTPAGETMDRTISCLGDKLAFRSVAYTKGDPARADVQEVLFSWRYNGRWTAVVNRPKEMERIAGMYKVQVLCRLQPGETRSMANPCEAFLELMVPELEKQIREHSRSLQASPRS